MSNEATSFAEDFDPPVVEPVRGIGDVTFARADMDYWSAWARALKDKRRLEGEAKLNKMFGLDAQVKAQATLRLLRDDVQIFEVLNQQYTPDGITKILDDAMARGGMTDPAQRKRVLKRIGPGRQQQLASEVCSEPVATIEQLRDAVRQRAAKMGMSAAEVSSLTDDDLIRIAAEYDPPATATKQLALADPEAAGGVGSPLAAAGAAGSTGDSVPPSSDTSSASTPDVSPSAAT